MRPDLQVVAGDRRPRTHRRWVRRLLLAATLVVVVLGIVGMHQMAFGHDMALSPATSSAQGDHAGHSGTGEMLPMAAAHAGAHADAGRSGTGTGGGCPDCADHQMALGSCLLALTLLVLRWLLAPPRPARVLPFLLPRLTRLSRLVTLFVAGRLIPPLSLAELSVLRT
ncbi:DUF6153 family protein [Microlunatus spumicola]|uniref:DUF6153 family protein n=1 Tax=Microlunatus spumicola TaxID=81499 RepID=UPI00195B201C